MKTHFSLYRTQLLITGLTVDEMMKVETVFSRYNILYKNSVSQVAKLQGFDLICATEADYHTNKNLIHECKLPFVLIGEKDLEGSRGLIIRSSLIHQWYETIHQIIPPVKKPKIEALDIGIVVRSKTTPLFGRGVVIEIISADEVMVKFPTNKILAKEKAIRCHKSQLQILGNIEELKNK